MPPNAPHPTTTAATGTSTPTAAKCVIVASHVRSTAVRSHFHRHYAELCRRRNRQPLSELREHTKSVLDFHCDRVRLDDWPLILEALAADDGLVGLNVLARKSCSHGEYAVIVTAHAFPISMSTALHLQSSNPLTAKRNVGHCARSRPSALSSFSLR